MGGVSTSNSFALRWWVSSFVAGAGDEGGWLEMGYFDIDDAEFLVDDVWIIEIHGVNK